jgi:hypothetical protein
MTIENRASIRHDVQIGQLDRVILSTSGNGVHLMRQGSRALWFGIGLVCLLLSGCYKETVTGDVTTITYAWWVTLLALVCGVGAIAVGWAIRENEELERLCWGLIGGGSLLLLIVVPITFRNKVAVDPQHVASTSGFWFFGSSNDIKFVDIHRMELHSKASRRSISYYLLCFKRQGGKVEVPVGDLVKPVLPQIIAMAVTNNVEFVDKTND